MLRTSEYALAVYVLTQTLHQVSSLVVALGLAS